VLFCWAGVAAPAQRHFRVMAFPEICGISACGIWQDASGQACGRRAQCAWRERAQGNGEASCSIAGSRETRGYDLRSVTVRSPLDPVVGGSLEDAFYYLISWCTGQVLLASAKIKCHTHVPLACRFGTRLAGLSCSRTIPPVAFRSGRKTLQLPDVRTPTLRRRELGARLRALRLARGLTVEQVAEQLLCSPSKVSRMETGQRGATLRDVRDLCRIYELTDPAQVDYLSELVREAKQQAWWQSYDLDFTTYVGLEQAATSLCYYQSTIVPGLLQSLEYAKAMHLGSMPGEFTQERVDDLIEVRVRRQQVILTRDPPLQLRVVLDEAVLHRVVGGPAVMAGQMEHFAALAKYPNVTLQIIPFSLGAHPAMENMFNILEFGDIAPRVVYVEGLMGWLFLEREHDVVRYTRVFEYLSSIAFSPKETIEFISEVGARYHHAARSASSNAIS
jgi:transcriptional regulator with XRE-family HTH domain